MKDSKLTQFRCECGRLLLVEGQVIGKKAVQAAAGSEREAFDLQEIVSEIYDVFGLVPALAECDGRGKAVQPQEREQLIAIIRKVAARAAAPPNGPNENGHTVGCQCNECYNQQFLRENLGMCDNQGEHQISIHNTPHTKRTFCVNWRAVAPAPPSREPRFDEFDDETHPANIWWKKHGQFMMSGGGRREFIWACRGWIAREQLACGVEVTGESMRESPPVADSGASAGEEKHGEN